MSKVEGLPKGFKQYTVQTLQKRPKLTLAKTIHDCYHVIADLNNRLEMCVKELPVTTEDTDTFNPIIEQQEIEIEALKRQIKSLNDTIEINELVSRPWWKFW